MHTVIIKYHRLIMAHILFISILIHVIYILQLKSTPYAMNPLVDAAIYHQKAINIVNFGWLGNKVFFQAPLYPYLLALFYSIFGTNIEIIIWIQAGVSVLNVYLIYLLGQRLFDIEIGIFSAVLALLYGVFIFYSVFLLKVTFSIFFTCLFLLFFLWASKSPSFGRYFKTGIFFGLCITLRGNFLLVFSALALWIIFHSKTHKQNMFYALGLTLGICLIILPITLRNYYLERDFVLVNYDAGPSYFIGNNAKANGMYQTFGVTRPHPRYERKDFTSKAEKVLGRNLKPSEVSRFWFRMSFQYILEKPLHWLALQYRKTLIYFNNYEKSDNYNYELMKTTTPILNSGTVSFGVIFVASLTGIAIGRWRCSKFWLFYIFIAAYSTSVILFYVNSRYRIPLVPALIPFAAWLFIHGLNNFRNSSLKRQVVSILVAILCSTLAFRPIKKNDLIDARLNYGGILEINDRLDEAQFQYKTTLALAPNNPKAHFNMASLLAKKGKINKAILHYRKTLQLQPYHAQAKNNLGAIFIKRGQINEAKRELLDSIKIQPDYADAHFNLGVLYNWQGNKILATKEFNLAHQLYQAEKLP